MSAARLPTNAICSTRLAWSAEKISYSPGLTPLMFERDFKHITALRVINPFALAS
jgi:hypothetical protein